MLLDRSHSHPHSHFRSHPQLPPHTHSERRRRSTNSVSPTQSFASSASASPTLMRTQRRRSSGNYAQSSPTTSTPPASPSIFSSSFVGSFEASLLSGRMANKPSNSAALPFTAQLGVLGLGKNTPRGLKCPDHITVPFGAYFWEMDNAEKQGKGSPYVGTLNLDQFYLVELEKSQSSLSGPSQSHVPPRFPGYRIPPKGQIQLVIKNANQTAVKLFLVPYDLSDMPPGAKTFLRQKSYDIVSEPAFSSVSSTSPSPPAKPKEALRYAIHLQFCAPPTKEKERGRKKGFAKARRSGDIRNRPSGAPHSQEAPASQHTANNATSPSPQRRARESPTSNRCKDTGTAPHIYLHKNIRVVFTSRALDLSEKLKVVSEGPKGVHAQSSTSSPSPPLSSSPFVPDSETYTSYTGPGEEWKDALRKRHELENTFERRMQLEDPMPSDPNAASLSAGSFVQMASSPSSDKQMPLLNTPPGQPSFRSACISESRVSTKLRDAAPIPESLTFQRSPTPTIVPLPVHVESGLSISRPGSRSESRKQLPTSPEQRSFVLLPPEGCLR